MNYLVSQIVNFITEQDVISDESDVQDFYRYGIEISISSLLNIVLVVIAGILIHHIINRKYCFSYTIYTYQIIHRRLSCRHIL